jgi:hypothetical protein
MLDYLLSQPKTKKLEENGGMKYIEGTNGTAAAEEDVEMEEFDEEWHGVDDSG